MWLDGCTATFTLSYQLQTWIFPGLTAYATLRYPIGGQRSTGHYVPVLGYWSIRVWSVAAACMTD